MEKIGITIFLILACVYLRDGSTFQFDGRTRIGEQGWGKQITIAKIVPCVESKDGCWSYSVFPTDNVKAVTNDVCPKK